MWYHDNTLYCIYSIIYLFFYLSFSTPRENSFKYLIILYYSHTLIFHFITHFSFYYSFIIYSYTHIPIHSYTIYSYTIYSYTIYSYTHTPTLLSTSIFTYLFLHLERIPLNTLLYYSHTLISHFITHFSFYYSFLILLFIYYTHTYTHIPYTQHS